MEKKITVQCCVPTCYNTNHMSPQILFFPFPKRREMQEKWLHAIRRPELKKMLPVDKPFHMFICLDHFRQNDVVQINQRTCLRAGVIPSVFKWSDTVFKEEKVTSLQPPSTSTPTAPSVPTTSSSSSSGSKSKSLSDSSKIQEATVIVNCGNLSAELHRNKFYCPGIHRECIRYNHQFITPKMFMIMGDKEKLKDWKNAIRIGGTKIRKFIESKQLDFHKHKEFCTGRCVARLPVNLFRTRAQPPEEYINTSGDISHIQFADGDLKPDVHKLGEPVIETEYDEEESDESIVDEKPDLDTLNALLKNPIPTAMLKKGPTSDHGITDSQMFWRGIAKLGLIDTVFDVVKESISQLRTNFIMHDARPEDAHLLSSVIREMGLSNKIQHLLASSKQDMDDHYNKLEQEMKELQYKVNQYETRKRLLKKRSEEFKAILDMNNPKHSLPSTSESNQQKRAAESIPDENVKRFKISHSEQLKRILQAPQGNLSGHDAIDDTDSPTFVMAKDSLKPGQILKIIPNEAGGQPMIIQKTVGADGVTVTKSMVEESKDPEDEAEDDSLPKIISVQSIKQEVIDTPEASTSNCSDDIKTVADIQNVVANGQSLTEKILQSTASEKDGEDVDEDDIDDDDLMETMEMYGDSQDTAMKMIPDPDDPNSQLIIYKRSDGKAETFRFSNNSAITQSSDEKTDSNESADEKMDNNESTNQTEGDGKEAANEKEGDDNCSVNEKEVDAEISTNEKEGDTIISTNEKEVDAEISTNETKGDTDISTIDKEGDAKFSNTEDVKISENESNVDKDNPTEPNESESTNQKSENDIKKEKTLGSVPEIPKDDTLKAKMISVTVKSSPPELRNETFESVNENSNSATESEAGSLPPTLLPEESNATPDTIRTRRSSRKRVAKVKDDL